LPHDVDLDRRARRLSASCHGFDVHCTAHIAAADGTPLLLDNERFGANAKGPWAAEVSGFDVHAGVTVRADPRSASSDRLPILVHYPCGDAV
jgi:hypothetical protein